MLSRRARAIVDQLRATPLHPQWLLGTRRKLISKLQTVARGRVLDIGCADRWLERHLPHGTRYIGVDYPATGQQLYGAQPDLLADAAALPLRDACVDTVIILEVVEHLRFPREALHEIARVLRPGGRLLLSVPFLYPIHDAPHDYQRYTLHGLVREIEAAGLRIEEAAPALGSAQTAGLITCLALAGMTVEALRRRSLATVLIPLVAVIVPVVNLLAWSAAKLLPPWPAVTAGYVAVAAKP